MLLSAWYSGNYTLIYLRTYFYDSFSNRVFFKFANFVGLPSIAAPIPESEIEPQIKIKLLIIFLKILFINN